MTQAPLQRQGHNSIRRLGRYRLLLELGHGGMGTIHLGVATGTGDFQKLVVLKELREEHATDEAFVEMFMREAMLAGRLNHVNVVQTIEAAQDGRQLFLAMEFLDGQPLLQVMPSAFQAPAASTRLMLHLLCEVLAGLHYAHELKDYGGNALDIVHCDMCPHNVFVTCDGHVKVVDFGIARAAGSGSSNSGFRGRLAYAAPEQVLGRPVDRRADIFAVGVMLWEALAQRRFVQRGPPQEEVVRARLNGEEPKIADVAPNIHPELASVCNKALSVEPADRFATAEEFRQEISRLLVRLGGPVDTGVISSFMNVKFAEQRSALHRLIHDSTQEEEETSIKGRSLFLDPQLGNEEVTRIADLSPLVELTRPGDGVDLVPTFRPKRTRLVIVAAVVASVGLASWLLLVKEPAPTQSTATASNEPLEPIPLDIKPRDPAAPATTVAAEAESATATTNARALAGDTETAPLAAIDQNASDDQASKRTSNDTRSATDSRLLPGARAARRRSSLPEAADPTEGDRPGGVEGPQPIAETPRSAASPRPRPTAGQDLSPPGRKRRELDVDNPFR